MLSGAGLSSIQQKTAGFRLDDPAKKGGTFAWMIPPKKAGFRFTQ